MLKAARGRDGGYRSMVLTAAAAVSAITKGFKIVAP